MLDVLLDDDDDESGWRLLILEDTGELLAADAKYQTGQGLSRLLNVVDGLIGQGLRVIVLVTTNEPLRAAPPGGRPAGPVRRPGRVHGVLRRRRPTRGSSVTAGAGDGSARTLASLFGHARRARAAGEAPVSASPRLNTAVGGVVADRHASVVSTASTRPLYGRGAGSIPAGGSLHARSSADRARPATAEVAGSSPAGRISPCADVAQTEEHRSATPERPVRSGSSASKARGVTEARRAPTSQVRVRILAGLLPIDRRGPKRSGYLVKAGRRALDPRRSSAATRPHPTTATHDSAAGRRRCRLSTPHRQVAGSSPARSIRAPVAQWQSSSAAGPTTAAALHPNPPTRKEGDDVLPRAVRNAGPSGREAPCRREDPLNLPGFHGGAHVRVFVEDTTFRKWPRPAAGAADRLRIADCANEISLWFELDSPDSARTRCTRSTRCSGHSSASATRSTRRRELYAHRATHRRRRAPASGARETAPGEQAIAHWHEQQEPCAPVRSARHDRNTQPNPRRLERRCPCPISRVSARRRSRRRSRARSRTARGGFAWAVDDWARLRRFLILGSEGGSYYAARAEADARERRGGRALHRGRRRARGRDASSRSARRAARRRTTRRCSRSRWRPAPATRRRARRRSRRCRGCAAPARTCSTSRRTSRASAAGAAACGARSALVRGAAGRGARLPGGEVPPARRHDAPRPAAPGAPGGRVSAGNPTLELRDEHRRLFEWIVRGGSTDGPAADRRGLRARAGGGDAGARRRSSCASTACRARRSRPSASPGRGVGGAARGHADDGAGPQPRDDDPRRPARAGLGRHGQGRGAARRPRALRQARVHPIAVLAALRTYAAGRGVRGQHTWTPVGADRRRARRRVLRGVRERRADRQAAAARARRVGLDGRRRGRRRAGPDAARRVGGAGARDGGDRAAARDRRLHAGTRRLAKTRPQRRCGWARRTASRRSRSRPRQRLDDVVRTVSDLPFGGTDCALPMLWALDAQARGRHVRGLHGLARPGRATSTRPGARASTAARRASTRGWSWSAWCRTASRSPTRTTPACSTSSASTPRRRSSISDFARGVL